MVSFPSQLPEEQLPPAPAGEGRGGRLPAALVPWARQLALPVAALAGYLTLTGLLFLGAWLHPFSRVIGDGADSINFAWFLGWGHFAVTHHLNPLLSSYIDLPGGANLTWSTNIPLPAIALAPLTGWLGPIFSYNLLVTLGIATSAWTAFLAIRRYATHAAAALAGGRLYGVFPAFEAPARGPPP